MYLFCDISICFDQCEPSCTGRQKRSNWYEDSVENQIISLGPIRIAEIDDADWESRKMFFEFMSHKE